MNYVYMYIIGPRPTPPAKPAPYKGDVSAVSCKLRCAGRIFLLAHSHSLSLSLSVSQVKDLMHLWYKPSISRDEACSLVKSMDSGSFIVRDSQTVSGYALTIKVSKELVRQRRKISEGRHTYQYVCTRPVEIMLFRFFKVFPNIAVYDFLHLYFTSNAM